MEKVIGQSVQKTNQIFLERYVDDYCKALDENFKQDTIRSLEHNLQRDPECEYSARKLISIQVKEAKLDKFRYYEGKKYYKVVREEYDERNDRWRDSTVHAFVDKKTGEVYKPASWNAPAKHVRFNLLDDNSYEECIHQASWAGGYLYMR